jgi:GDPmannose 4,6-dehydratase
MTTMRRLLLRLQPREIYHLAGQSHVGLSFEIPESTCELTAMGTLRLLELVRDLPEGVRLLHTSSSEIFGRPATSPQDEATPLNPVTPYGVAKAFATQMVRVYRESMGLFAVNAICYNHESPRRGENFVTRKIARAAAEIAAGRRADLPLGDITGQRDWGDARDYVRGMWLALNHDEPGDFIFATGRLHSVRDILDIAFGTVGLDWREHVRTDAKLTRAAEPHNLVGNPARARDVLGWKPTLTFEQLIREMTEAERESLG